MHRARLSTLPWPQLAVLALGLALLALACAIDPAGSDEPVPPQQWNARRGPVVPHDNFPRDCTLCHEGSDWHSIRDSFVFDHAQETGVALLGAHARAECLRCHNDRGPVGVYAARGCQGCHEDVHRARLGSDCSACHDELSWRPEEQIARHNQTRFPLVGAHAGAECSRCHPGAAAANFEGTSTLCLDCHASDLARATDPDHAAQGWTADCQRCHISTTWDGAGFNHASFPLTGQHAQTACNQCHTTADFNDAPTQCVGCHQSDYDRADDPPHAAAGFSTDCQLCHNTSAFSPANFAHTRFPLTGAHTRVDCASCHAGGVYRGLPQNCSACHLDDYQSTPAPSHAALGYPTSCEQCHTTVGWTRASFDHAGVLRGCVQCHQADYDSTNNPPHAASGFPTTCQRCHGTDTWSGATFNHARFPIDSGAHARLDCVQCHTSPGNFRAFSCTSCHEHNQRDTDNDHDEVGGYVYTSSACFQCHPNGRR